MRIQVKPENRPCQNLSTQQVKTGNSDPVKIFFDISFYLCISPFRITLKGRTFAVTTWIPQQIICGIVTSLCALRKIARIRQRFYVDHSKNAAALIVTACDILLAIQFALTIAGYWLRRDLHASIVNAKMATSKESKVTPKLVHNTVRALRFLELLNYFVSSNIYCVQNMTRGFRTFCIFGIIVGILVSELLPEFGAAITDSWSWTKCSATRAQFTLFVGGNPNCSAAVLGTLPPTPNDKSWSVAWIFLGLSSGIGLVTPSVWVLAHVWSLFDMVSNHTAFWLTLIRRIPTVAHAVGPLDDQRETHSWTEIIQSLTEIGKFSEFINKAISIQLAANIFAEVLYYPVWVSFVLRPGKIIHTVAVCLELTRFSATLLMAAALKAKVRQCIEFIYTETYWKKGWKDNFPKDMISFTMKKIAVKFTPGYDIDNALLGLLVGFCFTFYAICSGAAP